MYLAWRTVRLLRRVGLLEGLQLTESSVDPRYDWIHWHVHLKPTGEDHTEMMLSTLGANCLHKHLIFWFTHCLRPDKLCATHLLQLHAGRLSLFINKTNACGKSTQLLKVDMSLKMMIVDQGGRGLKWSGYWCANFNLFLSSACIKSA